MSGLWAERNLSKPPIRTVKQSLKKNFDFDKLLSTFDACNEIHSDRQKLEEAAALASRLIAKRAHSFRVQPSFMNFRKMNIALCRLKELNIYDDLKEMRKAIGTAKAAYRLDNKCHLPSPENFHNFLQKIQSFAKLLIRIVVCARESHRLFLEIVHRMAFIEIISLFMAVLGEVWTICISWCKCAVDFYNSFYPFYGSNFDQIENPLPKCLDEWLGDEYKEFVDFDVSSSDAPTSNEELYLFEQNETTDNLGVVIEQKFEPKLLVMQKVPNLPQSKTIDDESVGLKAKVKMFKQQDLLMKRDFKIEIKKEIKPEEREKSSVQLASIAMTNVPMDLGEKIERNPSKNQSMIPSKPVNVDKFKTITEIRNFISAEDDNRRMGRPQNTKGISDHEWSNFKTNTDRVLILSHQGLVLKKFKTLWQKFSPKIKI